MKLNALTLTLSLAAFAVTARADDTAKPPTDSPAPPATWTTLEKQARDLDAAIRARDVHPIHQIDHAVAAETAALQKSEPAPAPGQKQKFDELLADLVKQAHRAHFDGHHAKWDDAAAAQKQFADDVKEAGTIASGGKRVAP